MLKPFFSLAFFYGLCLLVQAQTYTAINYTVAEGLASNEVYEVFQDKQGFLWFATDNGVVRFDGYEFLRFGIEEGLTDPVVFGFFQDDKGRLWFRTFSGKLCYYENNQIITYRHNDKLLQYTAQSIISSLYIDSTENLYFSTYRHNGVYGSIDKEGNVTTQHPKNSVLYYLDIGKGGNLFGYQQQDLRNVFINGKTLAVGQLGGCELFQVVPIKWRGKLYISTCNTLLEYDGEILKPAFTADASIISLSVDRDDNLWVGYASKGVDKFSKPDFSRPEPTPFKHKNLSVTRVFQDNHNGLWISTLEQGIFNIPNLQVKNYALPDESKVRTVAASRGMLLIGSHAGNIWKASSTLQLKKVIEDVRPVRAIYVDSLRNVWITGARTSLCYDSSFSKSKEYSFTINYSAEDGNGNIYGVSGGAMLIKINFPGYRIQDKKLPFMCRSVFVQDTTAFIGRRNGLHIADLDFKHVRDLPSLSEFKINKILQLTDSTLFISTIGRGFLLLNTNTHQYVNYNSKRNFIANNIYASLQQGPHLWLGTESGLIRLKTKSLYEKELHFDVLTKQNGLISTQITNLAWHQNLIWAFSDNGYSLLNENMNRTAQLPRFYLKDVKVNNERAQIDGKISSLNYNQNNIAIDFGFISFDKPKIFVRHRLHKNDEWRYDVLKRIELYALAPGRYNIEIQYSFDNINWNTGYNSATFSIEPPLWKTWYFQTILILLILSLIYIFFQYQLKIYRVHQQKLIESEIQTIERERARIAKDLHDSVGTDFSAIKMTVSQLLKKHHEPHADEVENQFQNTIQEIKSIIYGLSPPGLERYGLMTTLKNYAEKINGKMPIHIEVNTFGREVKDPALSISIFRVIQELMSNTLKHAGAKNISIHVNAFDDLLNIVYEDDGKGFNWNEARRGAGLYNIESRVQSLQGELKFQSTAYGVSYTIDIPIAPNTTIRATRLDNVQH